MDNPIDYKEVLKAQNKECEICHRNFEEEQLTKYCKQLVFPADYTHFIVICGDCNYRMYLQEIENIRKLKALNEETFLKIKCIMEEFREKRDDIVSDSIVNVVGVNHVRRRSHLDLLYKYPNWNISSEQEMAYKKELNDFLIYVAKKVDAWHMNYLDGITSKKIKQLKEEFKKNKK